eukprot:CAMPEP_0176171888 /NCGR_PEP_ID=MMETSP0120_2-20121206/88033_1 /TAXON_ID=160619 /ORGANISM="Kryptoperidinium foliaceum, Strain CCMP 1326" /LENGTH=241 /DNA_ID=CAMNT_0017509799 /DNA_START=297 /DNA_END=1019 /DNA_ORIENTATION=+
MMAVEFIAILDKFSEEYYHVLVLGYTPLFGILSSASLNGRLGTTTTMATGHILSLANAAVKRCLDGPLSFQDRRKTCMSLQILLWLAFGASVGAVVQARVAADLRAHGALVWVAPAMLVLFFAHDHLAKPRSAVKMIQNSYRKRQEANSSSDDGEETADAMPECARLEQGDVHVFGHEFSDDSDEDSSGGDEGPGENWATRTLRRLTTLSMAGRDRTVNAPPAGARSPEEDDNCEGDREGD